MLHSNVTAEKQEQKTTAKMFSFSFMKDEEDRKIRANREAKPEAAEKGRSYT